jgi:hypothetical protein
MPKQLFIANCWAWSLARIYLRTIINTINGSELSNFMNIRITAEMLKNTSFDNSLDQFNNIDKIPITTPEGRNTLMYLFLVMLIDFIGINKIKNVETKLSKTELEQQFKLINHGAPPENNSFHHRELFFDDILKTIQYLFDIFKSDFDYIDIINEIFINFNFTEDQQKFIKDFITEFIKLKENKKCEFNYVNSKDFKTEAILNQGITHLSTGNYILFYTELNSSLQEIMREDLNGEIGEIDWHVMVITNYNKNSQEFIIENSWGKYRDPYFKISMEKMMDLILDKEAYITFIKTLCEQ